MSKIYKQLMFFVMIITASLYIHCAHFEETNPTSYIYLPGLTSFEPQLARYLPLFTGSTGEKISSSKGIHSIGEKVTICKFSEIILKNTRSCFKNPLYFIISFFIGLRDRKFGTTLTKDSPEIQYTLNAPAINFFNINLGQESDIEVLKENYNLNLEKYPNHDIVLYGTSRGAVTAFNFMSLYQPKEVKAAILEGIFDDLDNLLKKVCRCFHPIARFFVSKFTAYKFDGISPIKSIDSFPKDIPVLIISSKKDEMVPYSCAKNMYEQLRKNGHNKVHFLKLRNANHDSYSINNEEDRKLYENVIHAFYKHYNLPYDPQLAENGADKWKQIFD